MANNISKTVTIFIDGKQVDATLKSLQAELKKLRNQQRNATIGSEEYVATSMRMKEIEKIIDSQKKAYADLGSQVASLSKELSSLSSYAQKTLERINKGLKLLGVQGIGTAQDWIKAAASMSDAMAAVQKTTGLNADEVQQLQDRLKQIDTRTSREALNQLAAEAGKLGITGVEHVASFVESADRINVALGDDLGEGAITTVGKLAQVYQQTTDQLAANAGNIGQQMTLIGSALNSLGADSSASADHMVDFLNRMGGVSQIANLSASDILGFASVLDQANISMESSATAMSKLITQIFKKPEEFASAASMSVKNFTELALSDMNTALLALFSNLEGAALDQMVDRLVEMGMTGSGASQMLTTLAQNTQAVAEAQALATAQLESGQSVIDEFSTANDTSAARLEKLQNRLSEVALSLGEALLPVVTTVGEAVADVASIFSTLTGWLSQSQIVTTLLSTALAAYIGYKSAVIVLELREKALMAATAAMRTARIAKITAEALATGGLTAAKHALALAQRSVNAAMMANPYGAILTAIGAIVGIVTALISRFRQLRKESSKNSSDGSKDAQQQAKALEEQRAKLQQIEREKADADAKAKKRAADQKKRHDEYLKQLEEQQKQLKKTRELIEQLGNPTSKGLAKEIDDINKKILEQAKALLKANNARSGKDLSGDAEKAYWDLVAAGFTARHNAFTRATADAQKQLRDQQDKWAKELTDDQSLNQWTSKVDKATADFEEKMRRMDEQMRLWMQQVEVMKSSGDIEAANALTRLINQYWEQRQQMAEAVHQKAVDAIGAGLPESVTLDDRYSHPSSGNKEDDEHLKKLREIERARDAQQAKLAEAYRTERDIIEALETERAATTDPAKAAALQTRINQHQAAADTLRQQAEQVDAIAQKERDLANSNAAKAHFESLMESVKGFAEKSVELFSAISSIMSNIGKRELQELKSQQEARTKSLDDQLAHNLISEEAYNAEKENMQEEYDKRERELELENFERQRVVSVAQATINGAAAVVRALADLGPIAGPIAAGLIGAITAAQIAAILSEPAPYARGGYVRQRTVYQAGEAGPEWVASSQLLQDPETAPLIAALEDYQRGRRRRLSQLLEPTAADLDADALAPSRLSATLAAQRLATASSTATNAAADLTSSFLNDLTTTARQQAAATQAQTSLLASLADYLSDPSNRQAVIIRHQQQLFEEQERFLRDRAIYRKK